MAQQNLLQQNGVDTVKVRGYNESGIANVVRSGRGVIIAVNAGKLWNIPEYDAKLLGNSTANHAVTVTGVVYSDEKGHENDIVGFYIADSGRRLVSDMTRFVAITQFREAANLQVVNINGVDYGGYALVTTTAIKLWDEDINGTGNGLSNIITGNSGNNLLVGNQGANILTGGLGNDTFVIDQKDTVVELANEGFDLVVVNFDYSLGANLESILLAGNDNINGTGNELDNSMTGNSGNNRLNGLSGNDVLRGGAGDDIYQIDGTEAKTVTIVNTGRGADRDVIQFTAATSAQLWFSRDTANSNALVIRQIGTDSVVRIDDWFASNANHVATIKTSDGKLLSDSNLDNLVQAMASLTPPAAGETTLNPTKYTSLDTMIAANWQAA